MTYINYVMIRELPFMANLQRYIDYLTKHKNMHHIIPKIIDNLDKFIKLMNTTQNTMNSLRYYDHRTK